MIAQLLLFAFILLAAVALSVGGLRLVRNSFSINSLRANHELGGIFFTVLGTAYGVLLSFFIVAALGRYEAARATGVQESADLGSLFWLAQALPDDARSAVQGDLGAYSRSVVTDEWPKMARDQESDAAWALSDKLWQSVLAFQPATESQGVIYAQLLAQRQQFDHERRLRLLSAEQHIPLILWGVLILGGLVTVVFTYFFGMDSFTPQAFMTGALTAMIVLVLLLVYELDNPYQGVQRISPDGFQSIVDLTESPPNIAIRSQSRGPGIATDATAGR